ncbi:hypothetical protein [Streptomyces sp. NPDC001880]
MFTDIRDANAQILEANAQRRAPIDKLAARRAPKKQVSGRLRSCIAHASKVTASQLA